MTKWRRMTKRAGCGAQYSVTYGQRCDVECGLLAANHDANGEASRAAGDVTPDACRLAAHRAVDQCKPITYEAPNTRKPIG
jgi:hypothetical protein